MRGTDERTDERGLMRGFSVTSLYRHIIILV